MSRHAPKTERLLSIIRATGCINSVDLTAATGVGGNNQATLLATAIASGVVRAGYAHAPRNGKLRRVRSYTWCAAPPPTDAEAAPPPPADAEAAPPRRRKGSTERACMCCGRPFMSEGAHNRLCGGCRLRGANPFDTPATVHHR